MTHILRSYQVFGANDQILTAAVDAVKDAVKSSKKVERISLRRRGVVNDIEIGDVYVVHPSVCSSSKDFPTALLYANLRKTATGEGMVEFAMGNLMDPMELTDDSLKAFKDVVFKNQKGEEAPLIVFAPAWANPADHLSFVYEGEDSLLGQMREIAYSASFNPSLSSVFDVLKTDEDFTPITVCVPEAKHVFSIPKGEQDFPKFSKGLEVAPPEGAAKNASLQPRPVIRLRAAEIPTAEKAVLQDDELSLFDAVDKEVAGAVKSVPEAAGAVPESKEAAAAPGPWYVINESTGKVHTKCKNKGEATKVYNKLNKDRFEGKEGAPRYSMESAESWDGRQPKKANVEDVAGQSNGPSNTEIPASALKGDKPTTAPAANVGGNPNIGNPTASLKAPVSHRASFVIQERKGKAVWACTDLDGVKLGGYWSDDKEDGFRFDSKQAADDEIRRNFLSHSEVEVVDKPCSCGECTCHRKAAEQPGMTLTLNYKGQSETRPVDEATVSRVLVNCAHKALGTGEDATAVAMEASHKLLDGQPAEIGPFTFTLTKQAKWKTAGNWFNPGTVLEQFAPDLAGTRVDSPYLGQMENEAGYINPFGAPGKEAPQDNTGMGLNQQISNGAGDTVPMRQEMNFYGPDFARNFYAPHTDIAPGALTFKKQRAASTKKADGALNLFRGLAVARPEGDDQAPVDEHPQAHFDEKAGDPTPSEYIDPGPEVSTKDPLFIQVDQFIKGVLAAYAAQLIGAFQVTSRPISLGVPFEDTLDLAEAIRYAGAALPNDDVREAAVTQYVSAMTKLNDSQRRFLLENAYAQAAVWCNGQGGSGGFNYEVFVRATEVKETTLKVVVVTGEKRA